MSVTVRCRCGYTKRFPDDAVSPYRCPDCDEILRVARPEKLSNDREPVRRAKSKATSPKSSREPSVARGGGNGVLIASIIGGCIALALLVGGGILLFNRDGDSVTNGGTGSDTAAGDPIDALIARLGTTTNSVATLELLHSSGSGSPQLPALWDSSFSDLPVCLAASTELMKLGSPAIPKLVSAIDSNQTVMVAPPTVFTWGMDDQSRFEGRDMGMLTVDSYVREVTLADGSSREVTLFSSPGPIGPLRNAFRTWAGLTLARMGSPAIPAVEPLLQSANEESVEEAARILSFINPAYKPPPRSSKVLWRLVMAGGGPEAEVALQELNSRGPLDDGLISKELESQDIPERLRAMELINAFDEVSPQLRARLLVMLPTHVTMTPNPFPLLALTKRMQFSASELVPAFLEVIETNGRSAKQVAEIVQAAPQDPPLTDDELRRLLLAGVMHANIRHEIIGIATARRDQSVLLLVELLSDPLNRRRWGDLLEVLRMVDASDARSITCAVRLLDEAEGIFGPLSSPRMAALNLLANSAALDADALAALRKLREQGQFAIGSDEMIDRILEKHARNADSPDK